MSQDPEPIAYSALRSGTPMLSSTGAEFGTVETVLQIPEEDLFDGIVMATSNGNRFVDADQIDEITTAYVRCTLTDEEMANLPEPSGSPTYHANAMQDVGGGLKNLVGRWLGRGHWREDR